MEQDGTFVEIIMLIQERLKLDRFDLGQNIALHQNHSLAAAWQSWVMIGRRGFSIDQEVNRDRLLYPNKFVYLGPGAVSVAIYGSWMRRIGWFLWRVFGSPERITKGLAWVNPRTVRKETRIMILVHWYWNGGASRLSRVGVYGSEHIESLRFDKFDLAEECRKHLYFYEINFTIYICVNMNCHLRS